MDTPEDNYDYPNEAVDAQEQLLSIEDISSEPFRVPLYASPRLREIPEREAEKYYENRINEAKASIEEERFRILKQDREERQKYARYLFLLICAWLLGIYSIIILSGVGSTTVRINLSDLPVAQRLEEFKPSFQLSDAVLLALIGGTTLNVLGLFVIVANYLFKAPKPPQDPKDSR